MKGIRLVIRADLFAAELRKRSRRQPDAMHSLRDVVTFYAERDVVPQKWYPLDREGGVSTFDDLSTIYHDNVSREPPFSRHIGDAPPFSAEEIEDIVSSASLDDGHKPAGLANPPAPP